MPTGDELKAMARTKLKEAKILSSKKCYDGACYLVGYVVEFALKARICKLLKLKYYPDSFEFKSFKTHKLDTLLKLSGLEHKLDADKATNPKLLVYWSLIAPWSESFRYQPIGTYKEKDAKDRILALNDPKNGVFTWIKKKW